MKNLPKPLLQTVLTKLQNKDLANMCLIDQRTHKICGESFMNIVYTRYPGLAEKIPDKMSWMDWYKKILNSGSLFINKKLIAKNVCCSSPLEFPGNFSTIVYLTLDGNLYLYGSYDEILDDYAFGFLSDDVRNTLPDNPSDQSLLLATGIEDFAFSRWGLVSGSTLILNKEGELYLSTETSINSIGINFREILIRGNNQVFVVRNWDNIAYFFGVTTNYKFGIGTKLKELDSDIIHAADMDDNERHIALAVKTDGSLYCYTSSIIKRVISSSEPPGGYSYLYVPHTNKIKLFDAGVKDVTFDRTDFIILDKFGNSLKYNLPNLSESPFINNDNNNTHQKTKEVDYHTIPAHDTFRVASNSNFLITTNNKVYDIHYETFVDFGMENIIDVIAPDIVIVRQD